MSTEDRDDNVRVLKIAGELPDCPVTIKHQPFGFCNHASLVIDEHEREIRCAKCNAALDPFDYLHKNGAQIQSAWRNYKFVRNRIDELNVSVDKLRAEEKRLKASVRRLQAKPGVTLNTRGD
jgi:hypothetical protein